MRIELVNTGTELMLGRVLNTHQQWLCARLAECGYCVDRQTAVPDTATAIQEAVGEALSRTDLVITTGGLGPTSDDRTRDLVAQLVRRPLKPHREVMEDIAHFFARRNRAVPAYTDVQALVPEGAQVLRNACGTAPGLAMTIPAGQFRSGSKESWLIMLPGPPNELRPMFNEQVLPLIKRVFPVGEPFVCRTLRSTGLGESLAENALKSALEPLIQHGLEVGYCARPGEVDIRLVARGSAASTLVSEATNITQGLIGEYVFGVDDEEMPSLIIRMLTSAKKTLAVAESCTGGHLAHRLTNVPGASAAFLGGWITYSNEAKQKFLGVSPDTLSSHGAVSQETAREMAEGARARMGVEYALSVTGIAGPTGGTEVKPVGTVFIGLATPVKTEVVHRLNPMEREMFKFVTTQQALELLRRELLI